MNRCLGAPVVVSLCAAATLLVLCVLGGGATASLFHHRGATTGVPHRSSVVLDVHWYRRLPGGGRGGQQQDRGDPRQRSQDQQLDQDQQGSSSRHHSYSSHSSSSAHADVRRRKPRHYYTSLSDVLLCLVMALGWTVWLLSSFIKTDFSKYQHESVLVRGHVLQVSVEDDSLGTGIPTYKAIIDYMVPPTHADLDQYYNAASASAHAVGPEQLAECGNIQIRKQFETSHLLTEGFANVELLVLPHEPTYSVLKDEWEKEYALHQHQQQQRSMSNTPAAAAAQHLQQQQQQQQHIAASATGNQPPTTTTTTTTNHNNAGLWSATNTIMEGSSFADDDLLEWWRSTWFRRATITGAALLVLASVAGGIQVVIRLRPSQQNWGWAMVVLGVPLLLPTAIGIHYALQKIQKTFDLKKTFIIRGAERLSARPCVPTCGDMLDPRAACDDEDLTVLTSPTTACATTASRATAAAGSEGCYFVRVNHTKEHHRRYHKQFSSGGSQSLTAAASTSASLAANRVSPGMEDDNEGALATPLECDPSSSGEHSTMSSVTSVSSVSMQP